MRKELVTTVQGKRGQEWKLQCENKTSETGTVS